MKVEIFGIESKSKKGFEKNDMHVVIIVESLTIVSPMIIFESKFVPMFFHMDSTCFIWPHFFFVQIYKLYGYGQSKMHGSVINVVTNMNEIKSILSHLPHDDTIIGVFIKQRFEYKSLYMSKNVPSNMMIITLRDLIETPLYKDLNVTIHHQWAIFFTLHMHLKSSFLNF